MNLAILSLISAIVAALLVFVDFFGTPPLAISIFFDSGYGARRSIL